MESKHIQVRVNNFTNSCKEIYQTLMQELQAIASKLSPAFLPSNSLATQSAATENKFIAFEAYETQLAIQSNKEKSEKTLALNEDSLDYNYCNLHFINQKNMQTLLAFKQSMPSNDPQLKKEYLEEYVKGLIRHCLFLSLEEKEAKTSKNFKFNKSEFQQSIFSVFYELFLLSQERDDLYSVKKFAEAFLVNHFWRENKISHEYLVISHHYIKSILNDLYFKNKTVISQAQASVAEDLIGIAKKSYDYLFNSIDNVTNNSAEMMTELALFQAIYLYRYELTMDRKFNPPIKRIALVSGKELYKSNFKLKDTNIHSDKYIKKYLLNNNKILAMLKQAFRHCKKSISVSPDVTKTNMSLIIEFFIKTIRGVFSAIYQSNELKYDEKRAYYNSIKANIYILNDMLAFTKTKNVNCFQDDSIAGNVSSLEKCIESFIIDSDKEFEKEVTKKKLSEKSLLQGKKPKKKSKKPNQSTSDENQDSPGPSTASIEAQNENNAISASLSQDNHTLYNDALLLLIKRDYVQALKSFDAIKNNTARKELDLKIKAIVSMAECHIEIAKTRLKKKPLSYCFNHKKPVSAEIRNEIIEIMDQVKQALDCCDEAKRLTPKLPIEDRALFFGCIELVSLSALSTAKDLEKERNSYLNKMAYLKAILVKTGQYGQGVTTDPHHITARGVEWCTNCEGAISNITELANNFKQNVETSYNDESTKLEETVSGKTEKSEELFSDLTQSLEKMAATSEDIKELHELKALEELQELLIKSGNPYAQNQHIIFSNKNKKTDEPSIPTPQIITSSQ